MPRPLASQSAAEQAEFRQSLKVPLDRRGIHRKFALDAIDPRSQIGQNLPDGFQVAVRRVHEES